MTMRLPNPWLAAAGRALEAALNRALDLDPATREKLAALDGRALTLTFTGTPLAMRLTVDGARLRVGPAFEGESALRVNASPGSLIAMALRRGEDGPIAPGKVEISGDADLARRIEKLASGFKPDFEEAFARVFGDVIGVRIARSLSSALSYARERGAALAQDGADYLREEIREVPAPGEVEDFMDEVDQLRERSERLEARIARLIAAAGSRS